MNVHGYRERGNGASKYPRDFIHSDKRPAVVSRRSFFLSAHLSLSLSLSSLRNTGYAGSHNTLATIILTFSPRKQTDSRDTVSRRLGLDKQSGLSAI